ncbi:MAG: lineage-specific thermal regulator protein [Actinobacteria bacterium ADurb.Bin444]|nr:MAG: lineage-specific thermal regulator protein [Actinobacteria bacterium ADurb.Bin444]
MADEEKRTDDSAEVENRWSCPRGLAGRGRLRQSLMETALLTCLAQGPAHGYRLIELVEDMVGGQTRVDPGSVYRVLRALEEDGGVVSTWEEQTSGPSRRTYELTERGRQLLAQWAEFLERRVQALAALAEMARSALAVPTENGAAPTEWDGVLD